MEEKPNVVWVTLESTRADHTWLGGYDRETMPNVRRLAERPGGQAFENCFAQGIWTRSVSASILTGTYPSRHGAGMTRQAIPDSLATVPELLSEEGYRTMCVSPNANLSEATGLDRGFDDFVWIEKSALVENVGLRTLAKFALNVRRHGPGITTDTRKVNTGYMMTDVTKRWLRECGSEGPFFAYLHYGDPHHPYYPPLPDLREEADRLGVDPAEAGDIVLRHHADLDRHIAEGLPYSDEEWAVIEGMYDASIEYTDRLVGHLVDYLDDLDLGETIVVVTADHGEFLGERGLLAHKVSVHDAVAHVPAVVYGLDRASGYDGEFVQHADLMRTVLEAVGADTSQFQGIDLATDEREHAIVQRGRDRCRRNLRQHLEYEPSFDADRFHDGDLTALRTSEFKLLTSDERIELFRLPDEGTDVSDEYPEVARSLTERVTDWLETEGRPIEATEDDRDLDEAARRQLADLGYFVE
jgi:uncharacterized sulfatase